MFVISMQSVTLGPKRYLYTVTQAGPNRVVGRPSWTTSLTEARQFETHHEAQGHFAILLQFFQQAQTPEEAFHMETLLYPFLEKKMGGGYEDFTLAIERLHTTTLQETVVRFSNGGGLIEKPLKDMSRAELEQVVLELLKKNHLIVDRT